MNKFSSSSDSSQPGRSLDSLLVRSFQPADRPEVLRLHAVAAPPGSVNCDCSSKIDQIEETYFRRPQDHFWVAEALGEIVGTIAICVHDQNVAHLGCLRAADDSMDHHVRKR